MRTQRRATTAFPTPPEGLLELPTVQLANVPKRPFPGASDLPENYAVTLCGDCMEPHLHNGSKAAFSRSAKIEAGDFVVVWFRPEIVKPGDFPGIFKKLVYGIPSFVTYPWSDHPAADISPALVLECLNPLRRFAVPCSDVIAVHKCIGVVK